MSSEPSTTPGDGPSTSVPEAGPSQPGEKKYPQLQMPNVEQMMQQDVMDNCAIKSVISGVMGGVLGVAFGIFTASLDGSAGVSVLAGSEPLLFYESFRGIEHNLGARNRV